MNQIARGFRPLNKGKRIVLVTVAVLTAAASRLNAEQPLPKQTPPPEIVINGLTGEVEPHQAVVRPDHGVVVVRVCPADLINYDYTIKENNQELRESFPIVGVDPPAPAASGTVPAVGRPIPGGTDSAALTGEGEDKDLLVLYSDLRKAVAEQRKEVVKAVDVVNRAGASLLSMVCGTWPAEILTVTENSENPPAGSFFRIYNQLNTALDGLETRHQDLVAMVVERNLLDTWKGTPSPSPLRKALATELESLSSEIQTLRRRLNDAHRVVGRWRRIRMLKQQPEMRKEIPLTRTSARYTVAVERTPITSEAEQEMPPGTDPAKIRSSVIATTSFENRALHRFNVSLGMVGVQRDKNLDFEVASSIAGDGTVNFHVREIKSDEWKFDAAAFLGIYLRPVDHFNPDRGHEWMVMLGSEMSTSPSSFFLGFGGDTPKGVVWGVGVTEYEGLALAPGWSVGQVIPRLGETGENALKPRISVVPKVRKDEVGIYAFLGFRPSIFRAFLMQRRP